MSSEQTYVLVPGAGGDAWYWHLVAPLLREAGHEVVAPDLPAADEHAGLAAYADIVVDAIGDRRRVVVVAQSMGAFPATMACERADVASLVLVVPMIPAPGETPGEWWTATGQVEAERELALREGRDPDAPFDVTTAFLHDVPPAVVEALFARPAPHESDRAFGDPWPLDAWPDVPTRVLAGRHDRLLPFEFLCALARRRVGVACEPLDSGHLPALARPRELADRLLTGAPERVAPDR